MVFNIFKCLKANFLENEYNKIANAAPVGGKKEGGGGKKEKEPKKEPAEKQEKQPKKKAAKEEEAEELDAADEAAAAQPKFTDPLAALPAGKFSMDGFKRVYSNEDTATKAIPYFWENFDPEHYRFWT
jgi:elongation factor 1-gamma